MKGFYQAGRSAMSAAAQAANGTLPAGCKFEHHDAMDSGSATASRVPSPGDDAFSAEPGAHLIVRVLSARGLDAHPAFVSLRVASALGEVRGARARTLAARPAPGVRAHVWRTARDLRCEPREGDVLLAEVTSGSPDAVDRHAIESGVVARACVALAALPPDGASVRVPLHRNLRAITDVSAEPGGGPPATLTLARVPRERLSPGLDLFAAAAAGPSVLPRRRKRIFFVRHGESAWNEATREYRLSKMIRFDHPLNAEGAAQARRLGRAAAKAAAAAAAAPSRADAGSASASSSSFTPTSFTPTSGRGVGADPFASLAPLAEGLAEFTAPASAPVSSPAPSARIDRPAPASAASVADAEWTRSYADAGRCFVSPLTRAVQTAALLLEAHPGRLGDARGAAPLPPTPDARGRVWGGPGFRESSAAAAAAPPRRYESLVAADAARGVARDAGAASPGDGRVVFLRGAREIKSTVGSFDTIGIESGGGALDRAAKKLGEVIPEAEADAAVESLAAATDVNDAVGQWWTPKDDADGAADVAARIDDVFETLRFDPEDVVVVVGHSLFLRAVARRCVAPALAATAPDLVENLRQNKLENCGCVGMDVEFEGDGGAPVIVDARLMFGSGFGRANRRDE